MRGGVCMHTPPLISLPSLLSLVPSCFSGHRRFTLLPHSLPSFSDLIIPYCSFPECHASRSARAAAAPLFSNYSPINALFRASTAAKASLRTCMNVACAASTSILWRKGWALRSGEFADLCDKCGSAYEQSTFCYVFHSKDSGWRECTSCGKRLHCGCIASRHLLELLDIGGVSCINCTRDSGLHPISTIDKANGSGKSKVENDSEVQCSFVANQLKGSTVEKVSGIQVGDYAENNGLRCWLQTRNGATNGPSMQLKQEVLPSIGEFGSTSTSQFHSESNGLSKAAKLDSCKTDKEIRDMYESLAQTNLSMTLGVPLGNSNPFRNDVFDEREHSKTSSSVLHGPRSRHLLPKPPRSALTNGLEANAGMVSQIRVARPPAEGRGRNQLLPRYWPRITDQELQQISGDSNSIIVPLFEKMLSASDAGRIGRLVLPKACAEAYFPPISQPEGLPLRIQDVKGKEWVFQFRFWPNNNSRMYVLEGVTPCIQSMQLQAGDTVTFSRMDPEGKLIMGFRKATNSSGVQESHPSSIPNGSRSSETSYSGVYENLPVLSGYSGLLQSLKGSSETHLNALSKKWNSASGDMNWHNNEMHESRKREGLLLPPVLVPEKKRTRNIGPKSKRLLIDSQDALELKLTWEEAQDLLRPSPAAKPSIVMIEDHVFEEYEEPPVFGKRSIFVVRSTGIHEQWTQCDSCSKWRKLPVDVLIPPKWTCADNSWDQSRCSCSAPDELAPRELDNLLRLNNEFKKQRMVASHRPTLEQHESSGLDALANAAILGEDAGESGRTPVATTTKHPRHRPGCSCIVCIQPPSGKGKHKPTCTCNVCMTVKRRFKTLMMRKKKRQSEREAELAQRNQQSCGPRDESEVESTSRNLTPVDGSENEARVANELESRSQTDMAAETSKGQLDLNCHPDREDTQAGSNNVSMMSLLQEATLPLETYLKQNGLTSLVSEQQANSASNVQLQTTNESEGRQNEDCCAASAVQEQESSPEENSGQDKSENNPPS
ncbi:B3 domain-containing transcription repressor VAL2-like isoform X1 [Senna tora]|uniref:B3 domain-containing transcription repressor VAL2-like isoform X1 n=1 Tax=Senna tora TaxID=362788 RepID=A0A834TQV5_9FABA|nr:B3 domain-containing transcription repressor VAL2-like isoform X1 [Senna tora]